MHSASLLVSLVEERTLVDWVPMALGEALGPPSSTLWGIRVFTQVGVNDGLWFNAQVRNYY